PDEDIQNVMHTGAVNVIYGSSTGLTDVGNQFWTQDSPDVLDQAEPQDRFGRHLGVGDLNADGFVDLAIGVVGEDVGTIQDAGGANVLYGSFAGLTATGNQFWTQDSDGIEGEAQPEDRLGRSLCGFDF